MEPWGVTITMLLIECANCAVPFGIPRRRDEEARRTHEPFYCPNGHPNVYNRTAEDPLKVKKDLEGERDRLKGLVVQAEKKVTVMEQRALRAEKALESASKSERSLQHQLQGRGPSSGMMDLLEVIQGNPGREREALIGLANLNSASFNARISGLKKRGLIEDRNGDFYPKEEKTK